MLTAFRSPWPTHLTVACTPVCAGVPTLPLSETVRLSLSDTVQCIYTTWVTSSVIAVLDVIQQRTDWSAWNCDGFTTDIQDTGVIMSGNGTADDLGISRLRITNQTPKGFSVHGSSLAKKVAPVLPPKPKTQVELSSIAGAAALSNMSQRVSVKPPPYSSTTAAYTGVHVAEEEDLPPPPPELYIDPSECSVDMPAPPSPVSSSYSELRRANDPPSLHVLSAHGSVHRAPSSSAAAAGGGGLQYPSYTPHVVATPSSRSSTQPERELDALTQSLVIGLDNPQPDFYAETSRVEYPSAVRTVVQQVNGLLTALCTTPAVQSNPISIQSLKRARPGVCAKCGQTVSGEGGCTAMDKVYHISCFTCPLCSAVLQNQPFYVVENTPHCHRCYMSTLEQCCVCGEPILDRILRATGKPYHPRCFVCVVCGLSLDGVCFTVDAANQVHCIPDFHKKFAPKCSVCDKPIMPQQDQDETVRVVALDRSFHVQCYKCEDCGLVLSSEADGRGCYPLDGHVLCKSCNANRVRAMTSRVTTQL